MDVDVLVQPQADATYGRWFFAWRIAWCFLGGVALALAPDSCLPACSGSPDQSAISQSLANVDATHFNLKSLCTQLPPDWTGRNPGV